MTINQPSIKTALTFFFKAGLSATLFYFLCRSIDVSHVKGNLSSCKVSTIALSLCSLWGCYVLSGIRWAIIVNQKGNYKFPKLITTSLIGVFFNQGLPGSVGGDVYRCFVLMGLGAKKSWSIQSVLLDRIVGFFFMALLGGGCFLFLFSLNGNSALSSILTNQKISFFVLLAVVVGGIVLSSALLQRVFKHVAAHKPKHMISVCFEWGAVISNGLRTFLFLGNDARGDVKSIQSHPVFYVFSKTLLSVALTILLFLPVVFIARDLGMQLKGVEIFTIMPMVFLVSFLPISFAGWGVREWSFVCFCAPFGMLPEKSIALSILYGFFTLLSAVPLVLFYLFPRLGSFKKNQ